MAYSHVAHDTIVGDNCILSKRSSACRACCTGGFCKYRRITPVHQFCIVGQHTYVGGGFRVTQDVPPFLLVAGEPLQFSGLNVIGLRRRGFSNDDIYTLKKVYNYIYNHSLNVSQAKVKIHEEFGDNIYVQKVLEFLDKSKRGLVGK